ncbi:hypothetical protein JI435_141230 [Parastagonospora nodorum SN15]|uniref:Uncharacterized protein n=1 Tax=Phaeosphaeria nodorum (strain SN15 / ATCC MYA-4574 / FGSC 10173) TaxID=321614 RepID=A0A7U2I7N8_PHANO|nr:hypothetical protein JI435_141230 [Parastagonospora nodorum SN15]
MELQNKHACGHSTRRHNGSREV